MVNALSYITEILGEKQKINGDKREEQLALVGPQTMGCEGLTGPYSLFSLLYM